MTINFDIERIVGWLHKMNFINKELTYNCE